MELRKWRQDNGLTGESAAAKVGVSASLWSKWERRTHVPRPSQMSHIYLLTRKLVQPNDFYDLPEITTDEPLSADHDYLRRGQAS